MVVVVVTVSSRNVYKNSHQSLRKQLPGGKGYVDLYMGQTVKNKVLYSYESYFGCGTRGCVYLSFGQFLCTFFSGQGRYTCKMPLLFWLGSCQDLSTVLAKIFPDLDKFLASFRYWHIIFQDLGTLLQDLEKL